MHGLGIAIVLPHFLSKRNNIMQYVLLKQNYMLIVSDETETGQLAVSHEQYPMITTFYAGYLPSAMIAVAPRQSSE
jgi:hypothetical protein